MGTERLGWLRRFHLAWVCLRRTHIIDPRWFIADMATNSPNRENEPQGEKVTYDSVTIHYRADDEEPLTVKRVFRLVDSIFPGSGERALQVIDDPWKGPPRGLFDVNLILIPPEKISHLVLRKGGRETTATVEEVIGDNPAL